MIWFAAFSLAGTIALSYYCLSGLEPSPQVQKVDQGPVYDAKRVPLDPAPKAISSAGSHFPARGARRQRHSESDPMERATDGERDDTPRRMNDDTNVTPGEKYSLPSTTESERGAIFGTAMAAGGAAASAEANAAGYAAPDAFAAEVAPVPEPGAWSWIGLGAGLLIILRHFRGSKAASLARFTTYLPRNPLRGHHQ
ncbi:MAG: hypothetical protein M3Z64_09070 [Verrucomicrobiota bacterium]|nr:hypothetical protein [Verrucomicrobiota bacterium]